MEKILIIEKAKGMGKEGAIELLRYHRGLQQTKITRLVRQMKKTSGIYDALQEEIERRGKEGTI